MKINESIHCGKIPFELLSLAALISVVVVVFIQLDEITSNLICYLAMYLSSNAFYLLYCEILVRNYFIIEW